MHNQLKFNSNIVVELEVKDTKGKIHPVRINTDRLGAISKIGKKFNYWENGVGVSVLVSDYPEFFKSKEYKKRHGNLFLREVIATDLFGANPKYKLHNSKDLTDLRDCNFINLEDKNSSENNKYKTIEEEFQLNIVEDTTNITYTNAHPIKVYYEEFMKKIVLINLNTKNVEARLDEEQYNAIYEFGKNPSIKKVN